MTRLERRAGGEPLPAVAVVRARAGERVGLAVVRDADVAELRVREAVEELPADDRTASDAGPTVT
jgi:hypothetical protein